MAWAMSADPAALTKIFFPTDSSAWHGRTGEWMWASLQGPVGYRIENNPFYVYGISYHDIVSATTTPDGLLHFLEIIEKGGHSLYRLRLEDGVSAGDVLERWPALEMAGCAYESTADPENTFSIDVPPDVDVYFVYSVLSKGHEDGLWNFEEASFQHPLVDRTPS